MKIDTSIENIFGQLSSEAKESLCILSVATLLNDSIASSLLNKTGKANGDADKIIQEIRSFPVWHERTINTWTFDDEIRKYALKRLNGSDKKYRETVLATMKEHEREFES